MGVESSEGSTSKWTCTGQNSKSGILTALQTATLQNPVVPARACPSPPFAQYKHGMNFLKSAVASAIAQGPPFPYSFGDKVDVDSSIWSLYNGTRRVSDGHAARLPWPG